jgi:hypothetical protein
MFPKIIGFDLGALSKHKLSFAGFIVNFLWLQLNIARKYSLEM